MLQSASEREEKKEKKRDLPAITSLTVSEIALQLWAECN